MPRNFLPLNLAPFGKGEVIVWRRAVDTDGIAIDRPQNGEYDLDNPTDDGFESVEISGAQSVMYQVTLREIWPSPALAKFLTKIEDGRRPKMTLEVKKEIDFLKRAFPGLSAPEIED